MELIDTGPQEARLMDGDFLMRKVSLDGNVLTVTKHLRLDPEEGPVKDVFDVERRDLKDLRDGIRRCGFCEKTSAEVAQLIAGPVSYICNECVSNAHAILTDVADF